MVQNLTSYSVAAVDFLNRMVLTRVRDSANKALSHPMLRKWIPVILLLVSAIYIVAGGTIYHLLEDARAKRDHDSFFTIRYNYKRQSMAREISRRIFNDTRNLLIIVDKEQTDRVHKILLDSLKEYEREMSKSNEKWVLKPPERYSWSFFNAVNYAYSLLLTLGSGGKWPSTAAGQFFTVPFVIFGVPLFFFSIGATVYQFIVPLFSKPQFPFARRFATLLLALCVYVCWAFGVSLFLYFQVYDSFLKSAVTALASIFTIQLGPVQEQAHLTECVVLALLVLSTVSLAIGFLIAFLALSCYGDYGLPLKTESHEDEKLPADHQFTVVVDEAGETKLAQ